MSQQTHPWARYRGRPSAPQAWSGSGGTGARTGRLPFGAGPGAPAFPPLTAARAGADAFGAARRGTTAPLPAAGRRTPGSPPVPQGAAAPATAAAERRPGPPNPASGPLARAPVRPVEAVAAAPGARPITPELAAVVAEIEAANQAGALLPSGPVARQPQPLWLKLAARDSARRWRETAVRIREGWRWWRRGSTGRVLLVFAALYALLAFMRQPDAEIVAQSRREAEAARLQDLLQAYGRAGGRLLAARPFGGTELYPRGVVMQGEFLAAFARAPIGGHFVVRVAAPAWTPLSGFYGYPPVFAGGRYFQLERPADLAGCRFAFLVRRDSEREGTLLVSRVERMP